MNRPTSGSGFRYKDSIVPNASTEITETQEITSTRDTKDHCSKNNDYSCLELKSAKFPNDFIKHI